MKNIFFILILSTGFFISCNNEEIETITDEKVDTTNLIKEKKQPIENLLDKVSLENFEELPGVDYRGKVVDKYFWEDELGHNYIIATEYKSANNTELDIESEEWLNNPIMPDYSEMCIKSYIFSNGKLQQLYNFCDKTTLPLTTIEYMNKSIETTDIDRDGQVEIYYMYSIIPGGIAPAQVSLVVSWKSDKTTITGILPVEEDNSQLAFEKNYDDKFNNLPADIQVYVQEKWDKTMQSALQQYK